MGKTENDHSLERGTLNYMGGSFEGLLATSYPLIYWFLFDARKVDIEAMGYTLEEVQRWRRSVEDNQCAPEDFNGIKDMETILGADVRAYHEQKRKTKASKRVKEKFGMDGEALYAKVKRIHGPRS